MIDATEYWRLFRADREKLYVTLSAAYPLMPLHYVMYHVDGSEEHEGNPRIMTYVESDLGAAGRARELIRGLVAGGAVRVAGAQCLDIGCSNGALLIAAQAEGARAGVGIDFDPRRLESARRVGLGRKQLEFLQLDASTEPLPGTFDTIFCNDVLEHVSDWRQLLRHAATALAPGGTMFLSLHNARQPSVVLSEPHYGVPGLVLLPPADAAACWYRVRAVVGGTLDYEVTSWPLYLDIASSARPSDHGLPVGELRAGLRAGVLGEAARGHHDRGRARDGARARDPRAGRKCPSQRRRAVQDRSRTGLPARGGLLPGGAATPLLRDLSRAAAEPAAEAGGMKHEAPRHHEPPPL